jgi:hypothetical protein
MYKPDNLVAMDRSLRLNVVGGRKEYLLPPYGVWIIRVRERGVKILIYVWAGCERRTFMSLGSSTSLRDLHTANCLLAREVFP